MIKTKSIKACIHLKFHLYTGLDMEHNRIEYPDSGDTLQKSKDTKFQIHLWSKFLESRVALQRVVVASRSTDNKPFNEDTIKSVQKLLSTLVRLRDTYRSKSQLALDGQPEVCPDEYSSIDDSILTRKHNEFQDRKYSLLDKWYEKTKIGTIPKKGYMALDLPTTELIRNALKDRDRLIKRTRLDRSTHKDDIFDPETFNDDDFYHILLKEIISKEDSKRWIEIQRLRGKTKRKADTKATKGRKIKKDIMPKLVNFMAPIESNKVPKQIRESITSSLFGGKS